MRPWVQAGRATATATVAAFANLWYADVVRRTNGEPRNIRCVLDKDVLPAIGEEGRKVVIGRFGKE